MTNEKAYFCLEFKRWYDFGERELNDGSYKIQRASETRKRGDSKRGFTLDLPDGIKNLLIPISFQIYVNC